MITHYDFLFLIYHPDVVVDVASVHQLVKNMKVRSIAEINQEYREEHIKERVRDYPHISACNVYSHHRKNPIDIKQLAYTLNLELSNFNPVASKKNIQKILKHLGPSNTKVHISLPTPDVMLTAFLNNIKASSTYRPGLDECMFYVDVPTQFVEKKSYEAYNINCEFDSVKTLKYGRSPTMGFNETTYVYGDHTMITNDYDEFKRMSRHIKMYNRDTKFVVFMHIGEQYKKAYAENRIYEYLFEMDANLDNM